MAPDQDPSARAVRRLPSRPSLEHLKKEAKQRLKALQDQDPEVKLAAVQLQLSREYGFASWRQLKAHIESLQERQAERERIFAAARSGDAAAVRHALASGFDPGLTDANGLTIHQIAKTRDHMDIELLAREFQARDSRPPESRKIVDAILVAAERGDEDNLARLLDAHPELIDARGGNHQKQTALHKAAWRNRHACVSLLLERNADVRIRDFGDNAYAVHFAAEAADFEIVKLLVDAGSDIIGEGDDHQLGVLGWATCFRRVRKDIAEYLLAKGAKLNIWSAIALDRAETVRDLIDRDPSLLTARMSRSEHRRTALHHAVAMNRPQIVRLLIERGADVDATDAAGRTPLASLPKDGHSEIVAALEAAGAKADFIALLDLGRYGDAEALLRNDPARIGPDGRDTIALHLAVSRKNAEAVRWLIAHGVDVNAKRPLWDCTLTALHLTAEDGDTDMARLLLDAGADPDIRDDKYEATALGWAEYCNQPELAKLIRARGGT